MPPNARRLGGRKPLFALFRAVEVDLLDGARHGVVQRGLSLTVGLEACEHGITHGPVEDDGGLHAFDERRAGVQVLRCSSRRTHRWKRPRRRSLPGSPPRARRSESSKAWRFTGRPLPCPCICASADST